MITSISLLLNFIFNMFIYFREIATNLQSEINKKYIHLQIGLDKLFSKILLLKKKKYAVGF